MCSLKVCPECDSLVTLSLYFGGYLCDCGWEDLSISEKKEDLSSFDSAI